MQALATKLQNDVLVRGHSHLGTETVVGTKEGHEADVRKVESEHI